MQHKPVLRVAGPVWELVRYFLLVVFVAAASSPGAADMLSAPWLAAAAKQPEGSSCPPRSS